MPTKRLIIGLIGPKGSGKTTIARYLSRRYGARVLTFADVPNEILNILGIERTRRDQIRLTMTLRDEFGDDVLSRALVRRITRLPHHNPIVIDGVRMAGDIRSWKSNPSFVLIALAANTDIRYARIKARRKTKEEYRLSRAQFDREEKLPTERSIQRLARQARFRVDCNKELPEVFQQIDVIAKKVRLKILPKT